MTLFCGEKIVSFLWEILQRELFLSGLYAAIFMGCHNDNDNNTKRAFSFSLRPSSANNNMAL